MFWGGDFWGVVKQQEPEQAIAAQLRLRLRIISWAAYGPTLAPPGELGTTCR